jgi:hypothetical protein
LIIFISCDCYAAYQIKRNSFFQMSHAKVRVAVVEDNGMARANIRNHLLIWDLTKSIASVVVKN